MSKFTSSRAAAEIPETGFAPGFLFMIKTVLIAYCISVALLFLVAVLAAFQAFSDRAIAIGANLVTAVGVLLCGFMSGRHFSSKGLVFGALSGVIYSGILCIIGALASKTPTFGTSAVTALTIGLICGAVGGIVGINTKRKRRR